MVRGSLRPYLQKPKNITASTDAIRQWAEGIGDANPLYNDPNYASKTRWEGSIAPPGFESSMGLPKHPKMPPDDEAVTRKALRGVQLFHSGSEHFYYKPIQPGTVLYKSQWVQDVAEKMGHVTERSVLVTNAHAYLEFALSPYEPLTGN
jgi:acyl dehydratase